MSKQDFWLRFLVFAGLIVISCCTETVEVPELAGPSALAVSLDLSAIPDQLVADGWSSSVIEVVYRDQNGQRQSGKTIHFDLGARSEVVTGGAFSDIGNLAPLNAPRPVAGGNEARAVSAVTDGDGVARARYWAPFRTDQANDTTVTVTARPADYDYRSAVNRQVDIMLRAADRPLFPGGAACGISVEPQKTVYEVDEIVNFTATQATGSCGNNPIARYEWDFGDGKTAVGRSVSHVFSDGCESGCGVTLWTTESVTGCVASCSVTITTPEGTGGGGTGGGGSGGGGGTGGGGVPGPTLHNFVSTDVPKGASDVCFNGVNPVPCIRSTIDTSGVTGTIVLIRVGFHANFPDASNTSVGLLGPGGQQAGFNGGAAVGAGWGANCNINPLGSSTGSGATTWNDALLMTGNLVADDTTPYGGTYHGGAVTNNLIDFANDLNGNPGDMNGTFTLELGRPLVGGLTTETLICWTLEIYTEP